MHLRLGAIEIKVEIYFISAKLSMMKSFALITGASSGIGKEIALSLASKSNNLILVARRENRLTELCAQIEKEFNVQCKYIVKDLLQPSAANEVYEQALKIGHVHILVNNAGIGYQDKFLDTDWEMHENIIKLNSTIPTQLTYLFSSHMIDHKQDSYILNVASLAAIFPIQNLSVYSGSKAYLKHMMDSLYFEFKDTNISLTTVSPGGVVTEFSENANQHPTDFAKKHSKSAQTVAKLSIEAMYAKKRHFIVGLDNYMAYMLKRLLPENVFNSIFNKAFKNFFH